jgi:CRISPR/Cas system-associated exonuclease Cas4 (RecB family)
MAYFLQDIARHVYSEYKDNLSDVCIVFPNKRARLYFNKYLSQLTAKPLWAPSYYTVNELMEELSGLQVADPMALVFELYIAFREETKSQEKFDDFCFYLEIMLSDFDDIDKYLIDPKDIFKNLANIKNIESYFNYLTEEQIEVIRRFWYTFNAENISEDQKSFLSLWDSMYNIYMSFNNRLLNRKLAYEGMAYKEVITKLSANELERLDAAKYIIIGFNALNKCEKQLFRHLRNAGKAEFYWDYDSYYTDNKIHEAGYFLRDNIKEFPLPSGLLSHDNISKKEKNISLISVPSNIGQAKVIPQCLKKAGKLGDIDLNKSVIVLADENLLLPVLNSIPEDIEEINVSMGYPFKETPVYALIEKLADIHQNVSKGKDGKIQFYHKDVIALLKLPLFEGIMKNEADELIKAVTVRNRVLISKEELHVNELLGAIFHEIDNPFNIPSYILKILKSFIDLHRQNISDTDAADGVEMDFIYHAYTYIQRFNEIIKDTDIEFTSGTLFRLLAGILRNLRIPFSGEPLAGIQVMGILETRTLDFDNVIILSMNEDIYPKSASIPSFIPVSLRYGFDLPVPEHQDAIYAYYFYRLLQRARNIFLVYNSRADGLSTGERSRFLHQLCYEPAFSVSEESYTYDISPFIKKPVIATKKAIDSKMMRGYISQDSQLCLTPSALNTYLDCPLKFYFRYIAELKEPEEITENIDPAIFGSILHKAVNIMYRPYVNEYVNENTINKIIENKGIFESAINEAFITEYFRGQDNNSKIDITGRNLIIKEVIKKYVSRILEIDKTYCPFRIIDLEKHYKAYIRVVIGNKDVSLRIGGTIDRIDEKEGKIRIVDYKTGKAESSFNSIDSLFDHTDPARNSAAFQALMYSMIYMLNEGDVTIVPSLYRMRETFDKDFDYRLILKKGSKDVNPVNDFRLLSEEFGQRLKQTISDIYSDKNEFIQTEDLKVCTFCPYAGICHREQIYNRQFSL